MKSLDMTQTITCHPHKHTSQQSRFIWFSLLYLASTATVVSIGGSMRLLLVTF